MQFRNYLSVCRAKPHTSDICREAQRQSAGSHWFNAEMFWKFFSVSKVKILKYCIEGMNRTQNLEIVSSSTLNKIGLFPNYGYTDLTQNPLRSGHLDTRDAQSAKKNSGSKISYHIKSSLGATGAQTTSQKF